MQRKIELNFVQLQKKLMKTKYCTSYKMELHDLYIYSLDFIINTKHLICKTMKYIIQIARRTILNLLLPILAYSLLLLRWSLSDDTGQDFQS